MAGLNGIGDDATTIITSFTGEPISLDKYNRDKFTCTPTEYKYRVLKVAGESCPEEAMYAEPDSLCCTSRLESEVRREAEVADYLNMVGKVAKRIHPENLRKIPPNLKRLLGWLRNKVPAPVFPPTPVDVVTVHESHKKVLDIVKLVLMTEANITVGLDKDDGNV